MMFLIPDHTVVYIPFVFLHVSFWTHSRFISYSKDMRACTTSPWTPTPPREVYRYVDEGMHLWMNKDVMMSRTRQPPGRTYILIQLHLGFFAVLYVPIVSHTFFQHTFFDFCQIQMQSQLYHWIYLLINNISIIAKCRDAVFAADCGTFVENSVPFWPLFLNQIAVPNSHAWLFGMLHIFGPIYEAN